MIEFCWVITKSTFLGFIVAGGVVEPHLRALMRLLCVFEIAGGRYYIDYHIPGVFNVVADGTSRWERAEVQSNLVSGPRYAMT